MNGKFDGLKKNWPMNIVLLIVAGLFIGVGIFSLTNHTGTGHPQTVNSLSQALTIVAEASRTAQVANGAGSSLSFSTHTTPANFSRPSQVDLPGSGTGPDGSATDPDATGQNNYQSTTDFPTYTAQVASSTFPVSNATVRPTYTPRPTSTLYPTAHPSLTFTPSPTPGPGLPGLTMSSVISQLKDDEGFTCAEADSDKNPVLWMCDVFIGTDIWYHVDLYGTAQVGITDLVLSVFQSNPDQARTLDILDYVASLPYNGSDATKACQWVANTLPGIQSVDDVRDTFIGTVHFRLFGSPQGRYLEMGEPVGQ